MGKNNASDTEQSLTITLDDGQKATVSAKLDKDTGLIVLTVENVEGTTYEVEKYGDQQKIVQLIQKV